jgi:hypothetical protein
MAMMFNFPFYPFHHSRYYSNLNSTPYYNYSNKKINMNHNQKNVPLNNKNSKSNYKSNTTKYFDDYKDRKSNNNSYDNTDFENQNSSNLNDLTFSQDSDVPIFNLFGLQLYYDDILLVCLIFFLYTEGIKDDFLFIVLVLLLIS